MPIAHREVLEPVGSQASGRQPDMDSNPDPPIMTESLRESPWLRNLSVDKLAGPRMGFGRDFGPDWSRRDDSEEIFGTAFGQQRVRSARWPSRGADGSWPRAVSHWPRERIWEGQGGWGTWIRTKTNRVRVCCATVTPFPIEGADLTALLSEVLQGRPGVLQIGRSDGVHIAASAFVV